MDVVDLKAEAVASFDPIEWFDSELDAASAPDASSKPEENPDGVQVSFHSSSD